MAVVREVLLGGIPSQWRSARRGFESAMFLCEGRAIADWWLAHAVDDQRGGFYGEVAHDNQPLLAAPKCIILHARALWFFAEFAHLTGEAIYADAARRAFDYLQQKFVDLQYGGVVWMLDADGACIDSRKHIYAQAFAVYAFSAYAQQSGDARAFRLAKQCFDMIELHGWDQQYGGYQEAFAQDWGPLADIRLSEKEANYPRTMNTHLHVLEAYSGLLQLLSQAGLTQVDPVETAVLRTRVIQALQRLLDIYCSKIVDADVGHVRMFLNEHWQNHSHAYSFGHDIESSWLIHKACQLLQAEGVATQRAKDCAVRLAEVALRDGMQASAGMLDEWDIHLRQAGLSAWWVQAEAMVGFANMWSLGFGEPYLKAALDLWQHIQDHYIDHQNGEWHWFSRHQLTPQSHYKTGAWKAPYHNGRAMMMMHRLLK